MKLSYPRAGKATPPGVAGNAMVAAEISTFCKLLMDCGIDAEQVGPTLVRGYADFYRNLTSGIDKTQVPLLYSLLGSGTAPLKMSKADASYQEKPVVDQRCENCSSLYTHSVSGSSVCSQVDGEVERNSWCRLWNTSRL